MRCIVVGTVAAIKTRAAALQHIEVLRANVNREIIETGSSTIRTFKSLIEHYRDREMRMDNHDKKAYSTKNRNESYLRKGIVPRWGEYRPSDIKSVAVEEWLDSLVLDAGNKKGKPLAGGTKVKIRNIMSAIFRHGMRHELLPRVEATNPESKQPTRRSTFGRAERGKAFLWCWKSNNFKACSELSSKENGPWCYWIAAAACVAAN